MKPAQETLRPTPWGAAFRTFFRVIATPFAWFGAAVSAVGEGLVRAIVVLIDWPRVAIFVAGVIAGVWAFFFWPFPGAGEHEALDLLARNSPRLYGALVWWHLISPAAATWFGGSVGRGVWRVWGQSSRKGRDWGLLPAWPQHPDDPTPSLVVGEVHHPVEARQVSTPRWLTIPEKGLYTGVAIFGAVGTGKTSACMYPFAEQLLSWQADDPNRRAAALLLEVKGDFCYQVQEILARSGREEDYIEIGLGTGRRWNPLSATWLDPYSLAYTISSLLNQLFGKGREPFWQQAYTNLVRWIIETHRMLPGEWVTLQDVYRCAIDAELFAHQIRKAEERADRGAGERQITIATAHAMEHWDVLQDLGGWTPRPESKHWDAPWSASVAAALADLKIDHRVEGGGVQTAGQKHVAAIRRWYDKDWQRLSDKLRSSIVEGVSVFLSLFDMPEIAAAFCPPKPQPYTSGKVQHCLGSEPADLPDLKSLITDGKVLALNMPAGKNPALGRAIGVMLKNAWLQALMLRPAEMKRTPDQFYRPAVFICDEYQSFATAGEDDPAGDEKSFALTRQSRCIPIVATQSVSSLRAVLGSSEAWRALLQTLRTRIFLSLSDDASTQLASSLCGEVERVKSRWSLNETSREAGVSPLTATVGSGHKDMGWSKDFSLAWQALFQPREFARLENAQAICLPYDGQQAQEATRVYLKPYYLPREVGYWQAKAEGKI